MVMIILLRLCGMLAAIIATIAIAIKVAEKIDPTVRRWMRSHEEDDLDETECQVNSEIERVGKRKNIAEKIKDIMEEDDKANKTTISEFIDRNKR